MIQYQWIQKSVRQCLKAIAEIVEYKESLNNKIKEKLLKINYLNYKDSMQSLIFKDVEKILMLINEREGKTNNENSV